ncbi:MAG: hypothetical protein JKY65_11450 [Planctomycetes bacterium]|nr:hypothetical protein [Planctomycetota bacterium]
MTPNQQEIVADWILENPGSTPQQAIAALRQGGGWPTEERGIPALDVGPPREVFAEGTALAVADVDRAALAVADADKAALAVADEEERLPLARAPQEDPMAVGAGLEEFGADDVRIPQIKIKQAQTKNADGVPDGTWFLTSDLEGASDTREVVFLEMRKERSLLLPYGGGDAADAAIHRIHQQTGVEVPQTWEGPVCFSRDRVSPTEQEGIDLISQHCKGCPMSRWRSVRGRRIQDCAESYRILLYDVEAQLPAVFYARGSGIRPTRDLLTNLQVACRRRKLPAYGFSFTISTKKRDRAEGTYYVPVFGRPVPIEDAEEIAQYGGTRAACSAIQVEEE